MKSRFSASILLIALPVLAFCALGIYFLTDKAPKLINAEKAAVTREYRELAESLVGGETAPNWRGAREKGWRQTSKIDKRIPWGVVDRNGGRVLVWIEQEGSVIGFEREALSDNAAVWIVGGLGLAMLFVVLLATVGILLLWSYNREREAFSAAVIHDLRNPLVAIRGLAKSDAEYVMSLADTLLGIVKNAQDYLKLGSGTLEKTEFDLTAVTRESYRVFEAGFREETSGPVMFDMPDSAVITADVTLVRQILWNLFSNALKYAAPYGPVRVSVRKQDSGVVIEFADNGPGMSRFQMRRAFSRFYRAVPLTGCGKGGFGIGLSISRTAARRLGGDLVVRQNRPKGCVFTWTLIS